MRGGSLEPVASEIRLWESDIMWRTGAVVILFAGSFLVPTARSREPVPRFRVPEGFVVECVARPPEIRFPMFAVFDERGRLFVAESSGLDLYAEISAGTRKCRIRLLLDQDGDGRFETSRIFAEGLVFPMGLAWRDGFLYVADPPDLVALEDRDGVAVARRVILTGFGHLDNGSLHGLIFGPDGLLYMTMGTPDGYRLALGDGRFLEGKSGALIRCRPDGMRPQVVSRGFVNLVEVVFLPGGDAIGTDNWFQKPEGGLRDALVHLVEGGLFPGVPDEGTLHPVTGDPLPPVSRFPAVALSGLAYHDGRGLPPGWNRNLFSAQHNARAIGRHILVPQGASYRSEDSLFLETDDPDFHPSDVVVDADGSLLVLDTGAWYVQHCPTGRIRPAESMGGIYRVRWRDALPIADPRGLEIDWPSLPIHALAALLEDSRSAVRSQAARRLAALGPRGIELLRQFLAGPQPAEIRELAVWTLGSISDPSVLAFLRQRLAEEESPEILCSLARVLGRRGDKTSELELRSLLSSADHRVRLAAAEALTDCGSRDTLPALWKALRSCADRHLEHAVVHAISRLADDAELHAALASAEPRDRAAALLLLDQPPRPRGSLRPEIVLNLAASSDARLRSVALETLRRRPEWAGDVAVFLKTALHPLRLSKTLSAEIGELVVSFAGEREVQDLLASFASEAAPGSDDRLWAISTMARCRVVPPPVSWIEALRASLDDPREEIRFVTIQVVDRLQVATLDQELLQVAHNPTASPEIRMIALRAVCARNRISDAEFEFLIRRFGPSGDPVLRLAAAELLGRSRLEERFQIRLLEAARGDPLMTPSLLRTAFGRLGEGETAALWLDYIERSLQRGWHPSDQELQAILEQTPITPRRRVDLLRILQESNATRAARLEEFENLLTGGDPRRGKDVFQSSKAACSSCHRLDGEGGRVGPDLTRIGAVRSAHDLLESILFPSASFAQGYETRQLATSDGRVLSGILVSEDDTGLVLREASGSEIHVARADVEEFTQSSDSLMPGGLGQLLTQEELRDLIAFLVDQR